LLPHVGQDQAGQAHQAEDIHIELTPRLLIGHIL